jgi:hypothetical protein
MRYGPQDMTSMMGIGSYVGEVRRGPDGQAYQWMEGVDGLGNPIGFWGKLKKLGRKLLTQASPFASLIPIPGLAPALQVAQRALGVGEVAEGPDGQLYEVVEGVGESPVQPRPVRRRVWISIPAVIRGRGPRGMSGRPVVTTAIPGAQPAMIAPAAAGVRPAAMVAPAVPVRPVRRLARRPVRRRR